MLTLISATPSPFARMNRIALIEKNIPFELKNEIPWEQSTETPQYNPLEKLPILIFNDDGDKKRAPIYDSAYIQDYIVAKYADKAPRLLTGDLDLDLQAKQILTLSEGLLDAFVLSFFETRRGEDKISAEWLARQNRKVDGGLRAFEEIVKNRVPASSKYLIGDTFTIADIAVVCATTQIDFTKVREGWREKHPDLSAFVDQMEEKASFKDTYPVMFDLKASVV